MTLDILVGNYIDSMREGPEAKEPKGIGKLLRKNPELRSLKNKGYRSQDQYYKLLDHVEANEIEDNSIIEVARSHDQSEEAGLYMGFIMPEVGHLEPKNPFNKGMNRGQALRFKDQGLPEYGKGLRGLGILALGNVVNAMDGPRETDQTGLEIIDYMNAFGGIPIMGSAAYALYSMFSTKLFCNDENPSERVIQEGPFAMHRNPFYTGILTAGTLGLARMVTAELLRTDDPNYIGVGIMAFGLVYTAKKLNDYVKLDEQGLERQFGQEYTDYKARTNRFIPNPLNLFRKKKK